MEEIYLFILHTGRAHTEEEEEEEDTEDGKEEDRKSTYETMSQDKKCHFRKKATQRQQIMWHEICTLLQRCENTDNSYPDEKPMQYVQDYSQKLSTM